MVADARIIAAWDRASAPISRYFDLVEALATGHDEHQVVRGFRGLDKDLSAIGIRSGNPALYRPSRPISLALGTAMMDDLAARVSVAADRIADAIQEVEHRFDDLNSRMARFAKVSGDARHSLTSPDKALPSQEAGERHRFV
jgi:hypothetical protein